MRILFFFVLLMIPLSMLCQDWTAPPERASRLSPFKFTDSTNEAGKKLYNLNCLSCHGTPGKGNVQRLTPPPADPATDKIQHNTDGSLFFKISEGRNQMPSFKNTLSPNDIWNVISYIRTFNKSYVQQIQQQITTGEFAGALLSIRMKMNRTLDTVLLQVSAVKDNKSLPVTNAGVRLFVKRNFGQLPAGEEEFTNNEGAVAIALPEIPGDTAGFIYVSAKLTDEDRFGAVSKDTVLQNGMKVVPQSLTANRAMWNVVTKAPVWLLVSYFAGLLGAWTFIMIVLFNLRDIFTIGKFLEQKNKEKP